MRLREARAALLLLCCALQVHCAAGSAPGRAPARSSDDAYPGALVDSTALPAPLFYRQRIEARFGDQELGFAAVLQSEAGVLSLLAMTPYGTRAFLLEQRGQRVRHVKYVDRELPFPPRFILLDVHRTLFIGLEGAPRPDGAHSATIAGERVVETWRDGGLHERTFEREDGRPRGVIRIRYHGGMRDGVPPPRIELDNGWFGYQLTIVTVATE